MSLVSFIVAAIVILVTPGPTNTLLAASGAAMGWRRAALLPVAEAAGYLIAVTGYLSLASFLAEAGPAMPALKGIAAAWLFHCAWKLWTQPAQSAAVERSIALRRVFLATILNPKAMLVGAVLIPGMSDGLQHRAAGAFLVLSLAAGVAWTLGGSLLPRSARRHAYRAAAVVVGLFSVVAASSAIAG